MRASPEKRAETIDDLLDPNQEVTPKSGRTVVHSADSKMATIAVTSNTSTNQIISDNVGEPDKIYLKPLKNDIEEYLRIFVNLPECCNLFAGKAGFPGLRRLNRQQQQQQQQTTTDWRSECYLSKISALFKIFRKRNSSQ